MNEAADDKRDPQFYRVSCGLIEAGALKQMTLVDFKVHHALSYYASWRTGRCWPSYARLQELTGSTRDSISKALRHLAELGLIHAEKKGRGRIYHVFRTLPGLPETSPSAADSSFENPERDAKGRFFRTIVSAFPAIEQPADANFADFPCNQSGDDGLVIDSEENGPETADQSVSEGITSPSLTDSNESYELEEEKKKKDNAPSAPSRGNGRSPAAGSRPTLSISESTIRKYLKIKSKAEVLKMLKKGNYPIPEFLLTEQKDHNEEQGRDILGEVMGR